MNNFPVTSQRGAVTPAGDYIPAVQAFGNRANAVRFLTIPLDTAATGKRFPITGTRIKAVDASSLTANITVAFQEQGNGAYPMSKGSGIRGVRFDELYITWAAQAGETITLLVAVEQTDKIELDDPASQFTSISVSKAATAAALADISIAALATHTIAADATRRELHLASNSANSTTCRLGGAGTDATHGAEFMPGEKVVVGGDTSGVTAAILIYNPGPAAATISGFTVND